MEAENQRKTLEERSQMTEVERLRHSTAHVLATAIAKIWPEAQFAAGPPVENGFYYDVELNHRISTDDFEAIEKEMTTVVKENQKFERIGVSRDEALKLAKAGRLAALGERDTESTFKIDLLNDIPEEEEISIYQNGDFWDLCAGPHVPRTGNCKAFKLMSVASAFYKGDSNNVQVQRIYGTAFKNKTQLNEYLEQLEEAKKRDHRKVGKELGLFHFDESVGQGLVLSKPKRAKIKKEKHKIKTKNHFFFIFWFWGRDFVCPSPKNKWHGNEKSCWDWCGLCFSNSSIIFNIIFNIGAKYRGLT